MKYSLDTNVCIRYLNGRSAQVMQRLRATPAEQVVVCSVVRGELFAGAFGSRHAAETLTRQQRFLAPFPRCVFDDEAALVYGERHAQLARRGTPIGPYDLQIAAIAIVNDLTLVTHNLREFARVEGLKIEDWES